ncbi:MAG: pentapeptide repeat-containing protein [Bacteroidetes bacterium]|nr:pentapeptide repeat-containing protein [Bacteroidota bacterium]
MRATEYIEEKTFEANDLPDGKLGLANYERCEFRGIDFSDKHLGGRVFSECTFRSCNLSNAVVANASFRETAFIDSKLTGVDFRSCNEMLLSFSFSGCILDYAVFSGLTLKQTIFRKCSMIRTLFEDTDLSGSTFDECEIASAVFIGTNLQKADLSTCNEITLDPERNKIKKAKFSLAGALGLLGKYDIIIE